MDERGVPSLIRTIATTSKITNYDARVVEVEKATFTTLVFQQLVSGVMGPRAEVFYKKLAKLLAKNLVTQSTLHKLSRATFQSYVSEGGDGITNQKTRSYVVRTTTVVVERQCALHQTSAIILTFKNCSDFHQGVQGE